MFDDLQKKQEKIDDIFADIDGAEGKEQTPFKQSPSNEETSKASGPVGGTPAADSSAASTGSNLDPEFSTEKSGNNVLKKLIILIVVLVFLGFGAYFVYSMFLMPSTPAPVEPMEPAVNNDAPAIDDGLDNSFVDEDFNDDMFVDDGFIVEEDPFLDGDMFGDDPIDNNDPNEVLRLLDSDNDGINDYDEIFVHMTDPNNSDTDGDGLSDWEELFVIGSNPLAIDSDGDGFEDGSELNNCYNPIGEGALNPALFVDMDLFYERYPNLVEQCEL